MKTRLSARRAVLASVGLSVAACTEEVAPEPQRAQETAGLRVREHLGGLAVDVETVSGGWTVKQVLGGAGAEVEDEGDPSFREQVDELADFLSEQVLDPDTIESDEGGELIYKLDPNKVCAEEDVDCRELLVRVPLRVRASGDLDLELLVGEPRHNPFDLELRDDRLAAAVDLGALRASALLIAEEMDGAAVELPEAKGNLRAEIQAPAEGERILRFAVTEALRIAGQIEGEAFSVDLAPSEAILSLKKVGDLVDAALALDVGALQLLAPISAGEGVVACEVPEDGPANCRDVEDEGPTGKLEVFLAGLTGEVRLDAAREALLLSGVGLGTAQTHVKVDGSTVFTLDLNPEAGRRFDAEIVKDGDRAKITVVPGFDLAATFATEALAPYVEELADWTRDESIRVTLDGADRPTLAAGEDDRLEVVQGRLTLSSRAGGTIVAEAGQCLTEGTETIEEIDGDEASSHPFDGIENIACDAPAEDDASPVRRARR